jgi:hypothetical protein
MSEVSEISKKLYDQILNTKFDVELFETILNQLSDMIKPVDIEISELETKINKLKHTRDQVMKYRDDTKNKMVDEVNKINKKMKDITDTKLRVESDSDDEESESNTWLTVAKNGKVEEAPIKSNKRFESIKITSRIAINALVYNTNTISNAPVGNLIWLADRGQFAIKLIIGDKPLLLEGNIGNIYVRGDNVSNVDLCRQSQHGRSCLKSECTFRHEPPKKGETRHYFSAPTYYPPRMGALAKEHKGVHRIGSRENLDDDLARIRMPESSYEYNAYIAQAFHTLLVAFVMERGVPTSS